MKLTHLTSTALLALVTTVGLQAGSTNDMKDMKQVSPAMTSDAGFYLAAYGGVNFSTGYGDRRTVTATPGGSNFNVTPDATHSQVGGVGGIKAGYNFESFPICSGFRLQPAVEVEALYIGMESKQAGGGFGGGAVGYNDTTSYNNAAGFVNGIIRFKSDQGFFSRFIPYIGIGVGAEYVTAHTDLTLNDGVHPGDAGDSNVDFAAQALAGVDYKLTQHWTLFTEYKFIDALGTDLKSPNVGNTGTDYYFKPDQLQQNLATVGVKYNF